MNLRLNPIVPAKLLILQEPARQVQHQAGSQRLDLGKPVEENHDAKDRDADQEVWLGANSDPVKLVGGQLL